MLGGQIFMKNKNKNENEITSLGKCYVDSPIKLSKKEGDSIFSYVSDEDRILYDVKSRIIKAEKKNNVEPLCFIQAGPREKIFFDPSKTKAGIVTCGGLCPGLNNVIRSLVMTLYYRYGVKNVLGFRYGYQGFINSFGHPVMELNPKNIDHIHLLGGTILGTSRGPQDIEEIVNTLEIMNINMLFCIGGDGTLKGANAIYQEVTKRNLKISVVGIPKTIDNDINFVEKTFGFETAFSIANLVIRDAHNEAQAAFNGIALVKLMGRESGFISANAALSMQEVNYVLIPELKFDMHGEKGFLSSLEKRLLDRRHAVIVVSEGAGQFLFKDKKAEYDPSGNLKFNDIGLYLKNEIKKYLTSKNIPHSIKYIDPSYIIRSQSANANDSKFCVQLAQNAVHGAMAGKTGIMVGIRHHKFIYLPITLATKERKKINLESELWWNVLESTGQPMNMIN